MVVISNPPQLYDSFPAKSNAETITGSWSFPLTPTIDANPASKKYVDDTAFSGAGVIDATATARVSWDLYGAGNRLFNRNRLFGDSRHSRLSRHFHL